MQVQVDHGSNRPVYQQIIDHVKRDVAVGRLRPGDRLPTVRQLASQLIVNPNTIAKAYRQLEQEHVILTRPGAGTYVAELSTDLSLAVRRKLVKAQIELLVVDAIHMQIPRERLGEWFTEALDRFRFDR